MRLVKVTDANGKVHYINPEMITVITVGSLDRRPVSLEIQTANTHASAPAAPIRITTDDPGLVLDRLANDVDDVEERA